MAGREEETGKLKIEDKNKDHRYPLPPPPLAFVLLVIFLAVS